MFKFSLCMFFNITQIVHKTCSIVQKWKILHVQILLQVILVVICQIFCMCLSQICGQTKSL